MAMNRGSSCAPTWGLALMMMMMMMMMMMIWQSPVCGNDSAEIVCNDEGQTLLPVNRIDNMVDHISRQVTTSRYSIM